MESRRKERPILFSGEMVRAILDGRKTQTRRVIKILDQCEDLVFYKLFRTSDKGQRKNVVFESSGLENAIRTRSENLQYYCPYGQPGDRLWVRETFGSRWYRDGAGGTGTKTIYKADDAVLQPGMRWKPSIHMPKLSARIWLKIIDTRVERLQGISITDLQAEGIDLSKPRNIRDNHLDLWVRLWDSINAKRGYSWETNPWVWVISFRRIDEK